MRSTIIHPFKIGFKRDKKTKLVYSVSTTQLATKLPPIKGTAVQATTDPGDN